MVREARDHAFTAGITTGDLSTLMPGLFGPMPAEQLIGRLICTDILVHTWDLAQAVGGDEGLDQSARESAHSPGSRWTRVIRQPGVFGPKVEAPAGADIQTEVLSFLGRQV